MVVIQINSECSRGSTGKIVCSVSKVLSEKGIENYIFYSGNHKSDFPNSYQINSKISIRIHQFLSRIFGDQGLHSYFSTKRLVKNLKKLQPDIILLHNIHGYYLHLGVLFNFLRDYDCPVYWTLHDCWSFTGHCTNFQLSGCEKWKTGCSNCISKNEYPYSWIFDRSNQLFKKKNELFNSVKNLHIITPSEWLAGLVRQSFLGNHSISVIHNGIDLDVFHYTENTFKKDHCIEDKKMILGVASVWNNAKGLDVLVEIAKRKPEWQVVLVGTDAKVDSKLPDSVISIHRTNNQRELAEIYSAADLFVNPTRQDNFPTVNMEAIACATPVLTFRTGGCPEIIDSTCGKIAETENVDDVIEIISEMFSCNIMQNNNYTEKIKDFASERCFAKYVDLISEGEDTIA